jgi:four helix bundle protein
MLMVQQLAKEAAGAGIRLVATVPRGHGELCDQVRRALVSVVLNTSEGLNRSGGDRRNLLGIARGSASEAAAGLGLMVDLGLADAAAVAELDVVLDRIRGCCSAWRSALPDGQDPTAGAWPRALGNMGCWVEEHLGVQGNAAHQKTASCHNRGLAIDIKRLGCEGSRARYSNDENLRYLARSLGAWFGFVGSLTHTICYKDIGAGFCRGGHGGHLHFGAKEGLGCPGFL